jgi:hypothetical protein
VSVCASPWTYRHFIRFCCQEAHQWLLVVSHVNPGTSGVLTAHNPPQFRAFHKQPILCRLIAGARVLRDRHVLGPWHGNKAAASQDNQDFKCAYPAGLTSLYECVRRVWGDMVTVHAQEKLIVWAMDVELTCDGLRKARGVIAGQHRVGGHDEAFMVRGPWVKGRTLGDQQMLALLAAFQGGGVSAAAALAKSLPKTLVSPIADGL